MPVFEGSERIGGAEAYCVTIGPSEGSKPDRVVLVLMDEPENDVDDGDFPPVLDDDRLATYRNIVEYAVETEPETPKRLDLLLTCPVRPAVNSSLKVEVLRLLLTVEPDAVLVAGSRVARALWGNSYTKRYGFLATDVFEATSHTGRTYTYSCAATYTVPIWGLTDPSPALKGADGGGYVNCIGQFVEHLQTALRGYNRYRLEVPDPDSLVIKTVDTVEKFDRFYAKLLAADKPCYDTETKNLNRKVDNPILTHHWLLPTDRDDGWYDLYFIPWMHPEATWLPKELKYMTVKLRQYFETAKSKYIVMAGGKFDVTRVMAELGVRWFNHRIFDVQAGSFAGDENQKFLQPMLRYGKEYRSGAYALERMEWRYGYDRPEGVLGKESRVDMASQPLDKLRVYGSLDVVTPYLIHQFQIAEAKRTDYKDYLRIVCDQLSMTIVMTARMEFRGALADIDHLHALTMPDSEMNQGIRDAEEWFRTSEAAKRINKRLNEGSGWQAEGMFGATKQKWLFDINKKEHQAALFFDELQLEPLKMGKPREGFEPEGSTDKNFQLRYQSVPEVAHFTEAKKLRTIKDNFADTLYHRLVNEPDAISDHRIRSRIDYLYVLTGRLCLAGDTPIYVRDERGKVPIRDVKIGDVVWSYDVDTLLPVPRRVTDSWKTGTMPVVRVTFSYGSVELRYVDCTPDHPFFVVGSGWVEAASLRPGSTLVGFDKESVFVSTVELLPGEIDVFDLTVDGSNNFVANGVLLHNSSREPNSQNQPSRGKLAKLIKKIWKAPHGKVILKPDFNAHEVRGLGSVSADPAIVKVFAEADAARLKLRLATPEQLEAALNNYKLNGDVHILNVKHFFHKIVDKKHPLRYQIKTIVFATVYEQGAPSLAAEMSKPPNPPITVEECEALIATLFERWSKAYDWLQATHREGADNLMVENMIGMRRHLYAYLHHSKKVHNAFNRRGPNSAIQGLSSQVGVASSYLIAEENWRTFVRNGIDLGLEQHNIVHDSLTFECHFEAIPIGLYLIEHGMTTLALDHYSRVYGVDFPVPFGFGLEIGVSEAEATEWEDQRFDTMEKILRDVHATVMDRQRADPSIRDDPMRMHGGRRLTNQSLDDALHNLDKVAAVRRRELRNDPFEMLLKGRTGWYEKNMWGLVGIDN